MLAFALAALALYVAILVHELGHAAVAQIVGLRFLSFSIWPICARLFRGRWKLVPPPLHVLEALGFVQVVPCHARQLRARVVCCVGGGPAASLFAGALAIEAATSRTVNIDVSVFLWGLGLWSALIGLSSLIPITSGRASSDRKKLLAIWEGEAVSSAPMPSTDC